MTEETMKATMLEKAAHALFLASDTRKEWCSLTDDEARAYSRFAKATLEAIQGAAYRYDVETQERYREIIDAILQERA